MSWGSTRNVDSSAYRSSFDVSCTQARWELYGRSLQLQTRPALHRKVHHVRAEKEALSVAKDAPAAVYTQFLERS